MFIVGWLINRRYFNMNVRFSDVPLYRTYGEQMTHGAVPYRDIPIEYPPGALPFFAIPASVTSTFSSFSLVFETMLAVCGAAVLVAFDMVLRRLGESPRRRAAVLLAVAAGPFLLGRVAFERFDLWPASLAAVAVALLLIGRFRLSAVALAFGTAAKLFPIALVPLLVARAWRRNRTEGLLALGISVGGSFICFLPFLVLAPHGTIHMLARQVRRPLQIETVAAVPLLVAHDLANVSIGVEASYGSINLGGHSAAALALLASVAGLAFLVLLWRIGRRGGNDRVLAAAVILTVLVAGKVLSPQFLLWAVPLVALIAPDVPLAAILFAVALLLTRALFPSRYVGLIHLKSGSIWLLASRDLALVASFVVLLGAVYRQHRDLANTEAALTAD